jgi:hypothetical protein
MGARKKIDRNVFNVHFYLFRPLRSARIVMGAKEGRIETYSFIFAPTTVPSGITTGAVNRKYILSGYLFQLEFFDEQLKLLLFEHLLFKKSIGDTLKSPFVHRNYFLSSFERRVDETLHLFIYF